MTPQILDPHPLPGDTHAPSDLGGLLGIADGRALPFPLKNVTVRASMAGDCCRTVIDQVFSNPYAQALEAVHIFPLPDDAAVIQMELRAGDVIVRAQCRERVEAEAAYEAARSSGRRAALMTQERADVHTLKVTSIPPGASVTVRMVLIQRLEAIDGRYVWRFPTVIAPRYMPGEPVSHTGDGAVPDTDRVPDASRIQPPLRLAGGTMLDLEVTIQGAATTLESSLHAVRIDMTDRVRAAPSVRATLNKDFVLRFSTGASREALARAYTDGEFTVVTVEPPAECAAGIPRDVVFAIDISGSMSGPKLDAARRALSTALHGLNIGDRFRMLAFDDRLEAFCPGFAEYSDKTMAQADRWIAALKVRGGTEILPALNDALTGDTPEGRLRTVLLITDGQAGNEQELAAAVARRAGAARLFTIGIDTAVNATLLKRLARIGGGTCELLTPRDDIEISVARIESRFGAPLLTDLLPESGALARPEPAVVFDGRPAAFILADSPATIQLRARSATQKIRINAAPIRVDFPLGALWARERVMWLEDQVVLEPRREPELKQEILSIALRFGIASRFTAFIAQESVRTTDGEVVRVVQPVELPEDWSEDFASAALCCMAAAPAAGAVAARAPGLSKQVQSIARSAGAAVRRMMSSAPPPPAADSASVEALFENAGELFGLRAPAGPAAPVDKIGQLARAQQADGSFGGDVARTATALLILLLNGSTRRSGPRRRVVIKAARWLESHSEDSVARNALDFLERAESGGTLPDDAELQAYLTIRPEGELLRETIEAIR